jgi:hypothetical protein
MNVAQGATRALFPVYAGLAVAALTFGLHIAWAQNDVAKITGNARVDMLLSQMTLSEKLSSGASRGGHDGPRRDFRCTPSSLQNGVVIGREARALGIDVSLQPFINIDRDLAFRRAYNTFGEDPLLTGKMGAAVLRGIQSQRVMAMAKHFIAFDTQATDVWLDEQTLREVYLAPFEAAIEAGGKWTAMR